MFTLHSSLLIVQWCMKKKQKVHMLLKNKLLLQKCIKYHLILHNIFAAEGSCLNIDGCWPIIVMVAQIWGGCGNFLKKIQWLLRHQLILPFTNNFPVVCNDIWQHFVYSRTSFKTGVIPLKFCHCFINQVYIISSNITYYDI